MTFTIPKDTLFEIRHTPHRLNPDSGWAKPHICKTIGGDWECSVRAYLWHGDAVIVKGRFSDLDTAWILMVDHLVRHNLFPTYGRTMGPHY